MPVTEQEKDGTFARNALCVFASLYTFFFVGATCGWGPMQRMLEQSGAFSYLCNDSETTCRTQSHTVSNMGFFTTLFSIVTPLLGHFIDEFGAAKLLYVLGLAAIVGCASMIVAATTQISWIYWIVFGCLGLVTYTGVLMSVQVGLLFQGHKQVRIIMWLNALFDAGSVTYLFLWIIQDYLGWSFAEVAMLYFVLALVLFLPSSYFWTIATPEPDKLAGMVPADETSTLQEENHQEENHIAALMKSDVSDSLRMFGESKMDYSHLEEVVNRRRGSLRMSVDSSSVARSSMASYQSVNNGNANKQQPATDDEYVLVEDRPASEQLMSMPFCQLVLFFSVSMISCTWSLVTAADFLASLGDDGTYLKIFTLIQPASILTLPIVDFVIRTYGFGVCFQCVNAINFVYILIKCVSTDLHVQVVTFFMVAAVRCFLYASVYSFIPHLLSAPVVGRATGFLSMVGGLASFLNMPLNTLAAKRGFFISNIIYFLAVFPCVVAVCNIQRTIKREDKIKAGIIPDQR